jgi:heme/copper-type cytochrome/quinol oxidase subunit 4
MKGKSKAAEIIIFFIGMVLSTYVVYIPLALLFSSATILDAAVVNIVLYCIIWISLKLRSQKSKH